MNKGQRIRQLLEEGKKYPEIMKEVNCASSTIAYHANIIGKRRYSFERKTYDWSAIQMYYDEGHTFADIARKFGVDHSTVRYASSTGKLRIETSHERKLLEQRKRRERKNSGDPVRKCWGIEHLCEDSEMSQSSLRKLLISTEIIPISCTIPECLLFGIIRPSWAGSPITLHLDHKNGNRRDNRLSNLRWLCPNCHSQTPTYCGRNHKKVDT